MRITNELSNIIEPLAVAIVERLKPLLQANGAGMRPRLLTVEQAAIYIGRTTDAMRALEKRGSVPTVRTDGRIMFDVQDLDAWIANNKVTRS